MWDCHCQWLTLKADRNIEVVFVTGKGGTGKTYYAKKLMEQMKYDYCVSSSSNAPWQDYMGQKGMLLDDLRDTAFTFEDLLKALDNDTSSSIKRRFSNVVFAGFVIIITSSVPLIHWYKRPDKSGNRIPYDELSQLYRRISTYVELKNDSKRDLALTHCPYCGNELTLYKDNPYFVDFLNDEPQGEMPFDEYKKKLCIKKARGEMICTPKVRQTFGGAYHFRTLHAQRNYYKDSR